MKSRIRIRCKGLSFRARPRTRPISRRDRDRDRDRDRRVARQEKSHVCRETCTNERSRKRILDWCVGTCQITYPRCFRQPASLSLSFNDVHASSFLGGDDHTARFTRALPKKNSRGGYARIIARLATGTSTTTTTKANWESREFAFTRRKIQEKSVSTTPKRGGHYAGRRWRRGRPYSRSNIDSGHARHDRTSRLRRVACFSSGENWRLMYW